MTSFLALRSSVCIFKFPRYAVYVARRRTLSSTLLSLVVGRSVIEWLPDRIGRLTLVFFFTPERAQFCSGASYDSIQRSQAVACASFVFVTGVQVRQIVK